ncbi:MAG: right-handed parallel beta-helix repeat-containing protein [bacterium]|nr:right-handed parallel beta-helix repeat-containing protein [bacterium]
MHFFGDLAQGASDDWDGEGRSNLQEYRHGTDPTWFATWYVDGAVPVSGDGTSWERAFRTVQDGIDRASEGDMVLVAEGIYFENIHFGGENITLRSTDPLNASVVAGTIIDGGQRDSVVTFHGTEDETCLLSGFTIRNGARIRSGGGGVSGRETRAVIENNVITANSGLGGGLCDCEGTIQRNVIGGNLGCGLYSCHGLILNNLIAANSEASMGGGLYWCNGPIRNNTIFGNSAGHFGGVYGCSGPIKNCIISGNTAEDGEQIGLSSSPVYCCIPGLSAGGQGNIAGDPRFVDAQNGDFRLLPDSPCIDSGLNSPDLPEFDIGGMPRIMFGGKSLTVDMGAYEFYVNALTPGPNPDQTTFTWSSLADKTYSIFYTDDLSNWHLAIDNFPSFGNQTTSWTDDGSLTGLAPLLAPKRFYRLLENL